ncbi:TolC family protein [Geotalea toluenoxydans]|uniref:TolC family protein n=1 Tax=Geotalea toluenoxydans TaxID=421624 RepID=UPI000AEB3623
MNLTMPLFSGFSTREQEKESLAALRGIEARKNSVKLQVVKDVKFAWLGIREATDRILSTEKEVAAAGENQALAMGRYQEGVGTIVEVTDAQAQHWMRTRPTSRRYMITRSPWPVLTGLWGKSEKHFQRGGVWNCSKH